MPLIANKIEKIVGIPPVKILQGINLQIDDGEFVALTGKSGSGKSSLLYILSSLDRPSSGILQIDDQELSSIKKSDLYRFRNEKIGFIFQFHYLIAELSALENVLLPTIKLKLSKSKIEYAKYLLEKIGLGDKMNRLPRELSGGQQQRVAVARAFVMQPRYLFADEPTGALDSKTSEIVMNMIIEANEKFKSTIILVTHDQDFANKAKRQINLADGLIIS